LDLSCVSSLVKNAKLGPYEPVIIPSVSVDIVFIVLLECS